jgi:hypothetical protein
MVAVWQEDGMDAGQFDGRLIRIIREQRAGAQIIGDNECRLADHVQPAIAAARRASLTARRLPET